MILGSQSPRRRQLLEQAGFSFSQRVVEIDESFPEDMPVQEVAPWLAQRKGAAQLHLLQVGEILLTADSTVLLGARIFNKPADRREAIWMLEQLSGQVHTVVTGVCLKSLDKERVFSGISQVHMDPLSSEEITYYVDRYKPYDKAGGYAIQEWIGLCKITRIEGTYANIMGLPTDLVYQELMNW